jgi:solute carrier family 10 (sodium/bile acid cotransporter), member 7
VIVIANNNAHRPLLSPDVTDIRAFYVVMAGLGLKTEEFVKAFRRLYFNAFVQVFNFGVVSSGVFGFSRLMIEIGAIDKALADGMVICGCLPVTVNMCVVLTKSAGGGTLPQRFYGSAHHLTSLRTKSWLT